MLRDAAGCRCAAPARDADGARVHGLERSHDEDGAEAGGELPPGCERDDHEHVHAPGRRDHRRAGGRVLLLRGIERGRRQPRVLMHEEHPLSRRHAYADRRREQLRRDCARHPRQDSLPAEPRLQPGLSCAAHRCAHVPLHEAGGTLTAGGVPAEALRQRRGQEEKRRSGSPAARLRGRAAMRAQRAHATGRSTSRSSRRDSHCGRSRTRPRDSSTAKRSGWGRSSSTRSPSPVARRPAGRPASSSTPTRTSRPSLHSCSPRVSRR